MTNSSGDRGQDTGVQRVSDEAQKRLNVTARARLQAISDAFRAYGTKIGAPEWASYDYGETARFVEIFSPTAKDLVEACLQEYSHPPADTWPSIADTVLRRIKSVVSEVPPLPQMVHTYPWRPSELFGRQDFLEAMLSMIHSHLPQPEAESIKGESGDTETNDHARRKEEASAANRTTALSPRDLLVHELVGERNFPTLTNAEIMKDLGLKRRLRTEHQLEPGEDATRACLDRIRRAKGYPLSRDITNKRSTQK